MRYLRAALALCLLGPHATATGYAQTPTLAGTWKLNKEASDDPAEKMREASEPAPVAGTGMQRGNGRIKPGTSVVGVEKSGMSGGAKPGGPMPAPFSGVIRPATEIVIEQSDTTVVIKAQLELPRILYLDGRKTTESAPGGESVETTTKWKDGKLTVERKLASGGSLREIYTLDSAKHRLSVEAKMSSPQLQETVTIKRVYDSAT